MCWNTSIRKATNNANEIQMGLHLMYYYFYRFKYGPLGVAEDVSYSHQRKECATVLVETQQGQSTRMQNNEPKDKTSELAGYRYISL